jgi:uncharacterized lipoprotein YajG
MKNILILTAVILVQACAFTDATLTVVHDPEANYKSPLGDVATMQFNTPELHDNRQDKERIGWKKNGYGTQTANISTSEPVETILSNAIKTRLTKNGYSVLENGRDKITGTVNQFWFDSDINFWTVEFSGDVQCTLQFVDTENETSFYQAEYSCTYSEKKAGGLEKTWQIITGKAVEKLVDDLVFDEDLAEALANF